VAHTFEGWEVLMRFEVLTPMLRTPDL